MATIACQLCSDLGPIFGPCWRHKQEEPIFTGREGREVMVTTKEMLNAYGRKEMARYAAISKLLQTESVPALLLSLADVLRDDDYAATAEAIEKFTHANFHSSTIL